MTLRVVSVTANELVVADVTPEEYASVQAELAAEKTRARRKLVSEVTFTLHKHDNADSLSIAKIDGTDWQCVTQTAQWGAPTDGRSRGLYIAIDALLDPTLTEFAFLASKASKKFEDGRPAHRLKTVRLRGKLSQGLLIPLPEREVPEGSHWADVLKIERYEPPVPTDMSGDMIRSPGSFAHYTDIQNAKNYPDVLSDQHVVRVTEKLHGSSLRFGLVDDGHDDPAFIVGSHKTARATAGGNLYSKAARNILGDDPAKRVGDLLRLLDVAGPLHNFLVFGEVFGGGVQDLWYGCDKNTQRVSIFDVMLNGRYLEWEKVQVVAQALGLPTVPLLYRGPFDKEKVLALRDGKTTVAGDHVREGVVVTAEPETVAVFKNAEGREDTGRLILKYISDDYLERSGAKDGH